MANDSLSENLLHIAEELANSEIKQARQARLRRAVSGVYYALFHFLAKQCADNFIGAEANTQAAWKQVYRALDHKPAKTACETIKPGSKNQKAQKFPIEIRNFANLFIEYQGKRHNADYDPFISWSRGDIIDMIAEARTVLKDFSNVSPEHCKAFIAFVLLKKRD